jgi:hypothetical protein
MLTIDFSWRGKLANAIYRVLREARQCAKLQECVPAAAPRSA